MAFRIVVEVLTIFSLLSCLLADNTKASNVRVFGRYAFTVVLIIICIIMEYYASGVVLLHTM